MNGILTAGRAEAGRIYKFWSEEFGVLKGERIGRGRGPYRHHVFFRGEFKRDGEHFTAVVGVFEGDNVKLAPVKELSE